MQQTGNPQVNTKIYWNYIYTTPAKAKDYWSKTHRFPLAVSYVKDGDKFIDLGCGVGIPGRTVKKERKGCEIWGVDISDEVIENNKKDDPDIHYFQGYIGNLGFLPINHFDVVFCGETIEHLDTPSDLFEEAFSILKPGGKLIITTPLKDHINSPEHMWIYTKEDVEKLYRDAGFSKVEFKDLSDTEHLVIIFAVGTK